jgi:hypothetical protein
MKLDFFVRPQFNRRFFQNWNSPKEVNSHHYSKLKKKQNVT